MLLLLRLIRRRRRRRRRPPLVREPAVRRDVVLRGPGDARPRGPAAQELPAGAGEDEVDDGDVGDDDRIVAILLPPLLLLLVAADVEVLARHGQPGSEDALAVKGELDLVGAVEEGRSVGCCSVTVLPLMLRRRDDGRGQRDREQPVAPESRAVLRGQVDPSRARPVVLDAARRGDELARAELGGGGGRESRRRGGGEEED